MRCREAAKRVRARVFVPCVGLVLIAAVGGASPAPQPSRARTIVLVSIDTLRSDHLGIYGYRRPTSPSIDGFARRGAVFTSAFSPSSWTLPAHASMLSGVSPFRHGATDETRSIDGGVPLLAETLRDHGYVCRAIVSAPYLGSRYGFSRGFERYVEASHDRGGPDAYAGRAVDFVRAAGREANDAPVFLFVHYMRVHSPYTPPPRTNRFLPASTPSAPIGGRRLLDLAKELEAGTRTLSNADRDSLIALYDAEIRAMDDDFRRLVEAIDRELPRDTIVILTSDHGEEFLEHGHLLHGSTLYDEVLRVPLIVVGADVPRNLRVDEPVSLLDIVPTVLEWAGAEPRTPLDGRSLVGFFGARQRRDGEAGGRHDRWPLALQTFAHDGRVRLRGVRGEREKLIVDDRARRRELYDLAVDPNEKVNRYDGVSSATALEAFLDAQTATVSAAAAPASKGDIEALKSLGYLQ